MAQNVTINGQSYSAVPAVQIPKTGGGTAQFTDVSDTTAVASDVNSGKYIYLANGNKVEGTQNIYSITGNYTQVTSNNSSSRILGGSSFVCDLTPTEGYLITFVTVTMGGVDITETAFVGTTGSGGQQENIFSITQNLTNVTSTNVAQKVVENGSFYARLVPITEYLITSVTVTMGGVDVTNQVFIGETSDSSINLQTKSVTPTETAMIVEADTGYDGLEAVSVGAISSTYVGSGITARTSSDLTASGATVTVPSGYYASQATKSVANGSVTAPASISGSSATVSTGTNTLTLSKTVSITPSVTTAGYVSNGTAGNSTVSLTASVTTKAAATINTSTSDQTISSGTYLAGAQTIKAVTTSNLTAENIKSGVTVMVGDSNDSDRIASVTGTYSGGSVNVAKTTWNCSNTSTTSHQFTSLSGTPKAAFLRCTTQLTRSSNQTYYYIADICWDGTNAYGNYHLRSNGSYNNVATDASSKYTVTTGTNSITFSSAASSRSYAPGVFYNGTYELTYVY